MKITFEEKERELTKEREALRRQIEPLQRQLEIVESNLKLLKDLKPKSVTEVLEELTERAEAGITTKQLLESPDISVSDAFVQAMKSLKQFTKIDLYNWIRSNYPKLKFSVRSYQRPLQNLMAENLVVLIKKNLGNTSPAVYEYRGK